MKCPMCGNNIKEIPRKTYDDIDKARRDFARKLNKEGYSYRQICKVVGWGSPRTAMLAIKDKTK